MGWAFQFAPTGAFTLEANVIFSTYALALAYAKTDPTAVVGKVISVDSGADKGVYMIEAVGADGSLKKVGSDVDLSNYVTKDQLTSVFTYKGSVANYALLPVVNAKGDVYNVEEGFSIEIEQEEGDPIVNDYPAGTNVAWNGESWDALAGSVDLSGYSLKAEVATLETNLTTSINGVAADLALTNQEVAKKVNAVDGHSLISAEKLALIDTNAGAIAVLQESDSSLDARLKVVEGAFKGEGGEIDLGDLTTQLTDHGQRITVLEGDNSSNKTNINNLQSEVSGHSGRLTAIETLNTEQSTQISGLTARVETVEAHGTAITNLTGLVNGHTESISTLTTGVSEAKALAVSEAAAAKSAAISEANAYADGLASNYDAAGTAKGFNDAMNTRVSALEAIDHEQIAASAAATAVAGVIDGAPDKFDTLKEIAAWIAEADTAEDAASLVTRVAALESIDHNAYVAADTALETSLKGYVDGKIELLGSAAYEDKSAFATAAQGALAETAAQKADTYTKTEVDSKIEAAFEWVTV